MKTKKIVHIAVIVLLAVAAAGVALAMHLKIDALEHENLAKEFSKDENFAQITLFLPESAEFTVDKIMYFRYNLENKLTEESMTPANEGARLYVDAYSAFEDMTLNSESRSSNVKAAFIGGDYRLFHKELEYAADITKDINHDRILLSRSAAWQLYGGSELYDFKVSQGDREYYISGVYDDFNGEEYSEFYGDRAPCVLDMAGSAERAVTCYELLLVNPVKSFAKDMVLECLDISEDTYLFVENSSRFTLGSLFKKITTLVSADEQLPTGVDITPEEMMARRAEKELAVMLVIFIVLALYPAVWVLILVFKLIKLIKWLVNRFIVSKIKDKLSYS